MSYPVAPPPNSTVISRVFSQMPKLFSSDAMEKNAIDFSIQLPTASITEPKPSIFISDGIFILSSDCSYIFPEKIDLNLHTLKSLVYEISTKYSSSTQTSGRLIVRFNDDFLMEDQDRSAICLVEGGLDIYSSGISWPIATNPNYHLVGSIAMAIKNNNSDAYSAIQQSDQRIASNKWLEYWGMILGVPRDTVEIDDDERYRFRMQREAIFPKSNNYAIAELISASIRKKVSVVDGISPFLLGGNLISTGPAVASKIPLSSFSLKKGTATRTVTLNGFATVTGFQDVFTSSMVNGFILWDNGRIDDIKAFISSSQVTVSSSVSTLISSPSEFFIVYWSSAAVGQRSTEATSKALGPITGSGAFSVKIPADVITDGSFSLSQELLLLVYTLINRYKPSGVSFTVEATADELL